MSRLKILCVEDEKDLRENIAIILENQGYDIVEAGNGQEALDLFEKSRPDLVLSDIDMPIMNGRDMLDSLNKKYGKAIANIPFIFLTAFGQKEDKLKGENLGADSYMVKPIDFDLLLATIDSKLKKTVERGELEKEKMDGFCENVSYLVPKEIQQPLQNIITIATLLKKEKEKIPAKYSEYISKIYLASLKLSSQITRALDKDRILSNITKMQESISISDIIERLKKEVDDLDISYEYAENIPNISINIEIFSSSFANYLRQHELVKTQNLSLKVFLDYANNVVFSVVGRVLLPVFSAEFESVIDEIGGNFNIEEKEGVTYHMVSLPEYLLQK